MDPPEVHVGELPRLVARGALRLLEPRDRLLELALLHQVATDIVVRVAEVGIDLDRLETLARRLLEAPLEAQGPPEERVRLCRRVHVDGTLVELDGALEVTLHLVAVRLPPQRGRAFQELGIAHRSSIPLRAATLRDGSPSPRTSTRTGSSARNAGSSRGAQPLQDGP